MTPTRGKHSRPAIRGRHRRPGAPQRALTATAAVATTTAAVGAVTVIAATGHHAVSPGAAVVLSPASLTAVQVPDLHSDPHAVTRISRVGVSRGDTLSGIAGEYCGNPGDYTGIAQASRISDPNYIYPGETLTLSCRDVQLPQVRDAAYSAPVRHSPAADEITGSGTYSFDGLENLWESAGGPAWAAWDAATIAECESGGRADAYNASGATGVWQILGSVVPGNLDDPYVNAENAVSKFRASGDTFAQWVCTA